MILYLKVFDALPDGVGGLWIAWPKKSSGVATDLSQVVVRKVGMASGLVDYKVFHRRDMDRIAIHSP